jgi:hypothetical protein
MYVTLIVIYCLMAAAILFELTFRNEIVRERRRKDKIGKSLIVINGGKPKLRRRA